MRHERGQPHSLPLDPAVSTVPNERAKNGRTPDQVGFVVQPRRCMVECFFARLGRSRRGAKGFEATLAPATTFLYTASVMLLTRRLVRAA